MISICLSFQDRGNDLVDLKEEKDKGFKIELNKRKSIMFCDSPFGDLFVSDSYDRKLNFVFVTSGNFKFQIILFSYKSNNLT